MKKILLSIVFVASGFIAFAQTVPLNQEWSQLRKNPDPEVFGATQERSGIAYNKFTNKLYLSDRNNKIQILDPGTGALSSPSELPLPANVGTVWPGSYKYTKIRVADDGAIYATQMVTGAGTLSIFRWASETDVNPTRTAIAVPARSGESLAVYGTGDNTKLYISGAASSYITVINVVAGVPSKVYDITLGGSAWARGSISPISDSELIINGPSSVGIRKLSINPTDGSVIATESILGAEVIFSNAEYIQFGSKKYIALSGSVIGGTPTNNVGVRFKLFDVATITSPTYLSYAELFSETPPAVSGGSNPSGYADVAIKSNEDGTMTFFHLVFGHGLASYTSSLPLPVSLTSFDAALVKGQSTLTWETASETNNKGFEVLRSTDGQIFTKIDFVNSKGENGNSSTALSYNYVDRTAKAGVNYYQLNQIDLDGKNELFKEVKSVNVSLNGADVIIFPNPATTYLSVNTGGEEYKGFKYELFDASGKKVLSEKAKAVQQDISLNKLPASIYYLKVSNNGIEQKTVKIIKQ